MNTKTRFPTKSSEPQVGRFEVRMVGTGAAAPTKIVGESITITRAALGRYLLTFSEMPGAYRGFNWGLDADTPANVAGHTVVADTPAAGASAIEISLYDETFALRDLAAAEYINLTLKYAS